MLTRVLQGPEGKWGRTGRASGLRATSSHGTLPEEPGGLGPLTSTEASLAPGAQRALAGPVPWSCLKLGGPIPGRLCWGCREADLPLRGERFFPHLHLHPSSQQT